MNKTTLNDSLLELEQANLIEIWLDEILQEFGSYVYGRAQKHSGWSQEKTKAKLQALINQERLDARIDEQKGIEEVMQHARIDELQNLPFTDREKGCMSCISTKIVEDRLAQLKNPLI